jgi:hypothetical protein
MIHIVVSFVSYGMCVRVFRLGCFIMGNLENNLNIEFDSSFELNSNFGPSLEWDFRHGFKFWAKFGSNFRNPI